MANGDAPPHIQIALIIGLSLVVISKPFEIPCKLACNMPDPTEFQLVLGYGACLVAEYAAHITKLLNESQVLHPGLL